jgi:hypothetical protein
MLKTTILCALVIYSYHCPNNEEDCPDAGHPADQALNRKVNARASLIAS